jgi:hypothetical protein
VINSSNGLLGSKIRVRAVNLLQKIVVLGATAFILVLAPTLVSVPFDYRWFYYAAIVVVGFGIWLIVKGSSDASSDKDGD